MPNAKLYIPEDIKKTLEDLCSSRKDEWTLFGKTEPFEEGFRLIDFIVPEQENGGSHTEIEDSAMEKLTEELLNRGECPSNWNVWIHSHNTMGAFFSGTDTQQMEDFGKLGIKMIFSLVVSSVKDTKKKMLAWCSIFQPIRVNVEADLVFSDDLVIKLSGEAQKQVDSIDKKLEKITADFEALSLEALELEEARKDLTSDFYKAIDNQIKEKTIIKKVVPYKWKGKSKSYYDDDYDYGYDFPDKEGFDISKIKAKKNYDCLAIEEITYVSRTYVNEYLELEEASQDVQDLCYFVYSTYLTSDEIVDVVGELLKGESKTYFPFVRALIKANPEREELKQYLHFNPFSNVAISN